MSSPSPTDDGPKEEKSRRPKDTKFRQQKLPAWKPVLTPRNVLPTLFALGVVFIAVGAGLLVASKGVVEQTVEYSVRCTQTATSAPASDKGKVCADLIEGNNNSYVNPNFPGGSVETCQCLLTFDLDEGFEGEEVYMYYELDNFYQNHRRYVKSRYDPQLRGIESKGDEDCDPYNKNNGSNYYAPCGLVANSLFNDTIELFQCPTESTDSCDTTLGDQVPLSGKNIAWESDRDHKFQNPSGTGEDLCERDGFKDMLTLPNWRVPACQLGVNANASSGAANATIPYHAHQSRFGSNGFGYENEDFIVWMRTAALPKFRKLYRKIPDGLKAGAYALRIGYNFPVKSFDGKKSVILSTTSWLGGKNPFLGACYITVGAVTLMAGIIFVILQSSKGRQLGADKYLSWDRN